MNSQPPFFNGRPMQIVNARLSDVDEAGKSNLRIHFLTNVICHFSFILRNQALRWGDSFLAKHQLLPRLDRERLGSILRCCCIYFVTACSLHDKTEWHSLFWWRVTDCKLSKRFFSMPWNSFVLYKRCQRSGLYLRSEQSVKLVSGKSIRTSVTDVMAWIKNWRKEHGIL